MAHQLSKWFLAIAIVLWCSTETRAQTTPREERTWRITHVNKWGQIVRSLPNETMKGCIASIRLLYPSQINELWCSSHAFETIKAANPTPN